MLKNFESYGTEKVAIGFNPKCGSSSVGTLFHTYKEINHFTKFDKNKIYVVIIRDVLERWASGQKQEILAELGEECKQTNASWFDHKRVESFSGKYKHYGYDSALDDDNFLKYPEYIYNVYSRVSDWFHSSHSDIFSWNWAGIPLDILISEPNIYFLDLKDLSSPDFLKWLQDKDEMWGTVSEIEYYNKTIFFWENIQLFWKEYERGLILKEKPLLKFETLDTDNNTMVCTPNSQLALYYVDVLQGTIDYIRNHHGRYIRL